MSSLIGMAAAVSLPLHGYTPGRHTKHKPKQNSPSTKLQRMVGRIGLTHPTKGAVVDDVSISPKKDIGKGPVRTLSQRDYKLTMAHGRRYRKMSPWQRQQRLSYLMGSM